MCIELYLKVLSIGFSWSTCVGFKDVSTKVLFKELPKDWSCERLIKTKLKSESR